MHGRVVDIITKEGIPNAVVDIWQASSNGKYDFQDPEGQTDNNLRGKFRTDDKGYYHFYCLKPTSYSLPTDGKLTPGDASDFDSILMFNPQAPQACSSRHSTDIPCAPLIST